MYRDSIKVQFGITEGGTKALSAYQQSPWSSLNDTNPCVSSSSRIQKCMDILIIIHKNIKFIA
jgi:hypothetical protein